MLRPPQMSSDIYWLACYVMLSRPRSLEGLLILRLPLKEDIGRRPPKYLLDEIDRLLALEKQTTSGLRKYLKQLQTKVPDEILQSFSGDAERIEERIVAKA